MSLERYHEEVKKRWPSNSAPSINIVIESLFGVWNNERSRGIGFNTNPKKHVLQSVNGIERETNFRH